MAPKPSELEVSEAVDAYFTTIQRSESVKADYSAAGEAAADDQLAAASRDLEDVLTTLPHSTLVRAFMNITMSAAMGMPSVEPDSLVVDLLDR